MTDAGWLVLWVAVLGTGLAAIVVLHRLGLRSTYARDLLHIGTGVWVLGWPAWSRPHLPVALVCLAFAATALVPVASRRVAVAARLEQSVTNGDERWVGLVWYTFAYALGTWVGLVYTVFPAAAALLALSLGDGIGGAVGRRFGRLRYRVPWSKPKSLEGSLAVATMAAAGAALASVWLGVPVGVGGVIAIGLASAVAEALAPRGTDNILVPAAAFGVAMWVL